jgi:RNA polymerase sigma factor (sigma-70 family)
MLNRVAKSRVSADKNSLSGFSLPDHLCVDMIAIKAMQLATPNDAELVDGTLAGNRDAFSQIVSRYQSLVCSLTYSATGNLGQSEDLAQETFITAWKHLGQLRERDKLRAWLCGIARNRINNFLRREGREPLHRAGEVEEISETHSPEPLPVEHAISREEQEILWRALERIPEIYREPLVLFYREHQSVEHVAQALELSEDTVHQRLSRGRKLLHEQVLAFVEGALERTNPGKVFTLGVLAALPALTISAKAATIGVTAAKGGATAKAASAMGLFGAIFMPLLVIFGNYSSYRMSMDEAQTAEERGHIKSLFRNSLVCTLIISAVLSVPLYWTCRNQQDSTLFWATLTTGVIVIYFLTVSAFSFGSLQTRRRYLAGLLARECAGNFPPAAYEYRSRSSLFGLPLVHVRLGDRFDLLRGPVKAWIAIGSSHTVGVIFASGGIAVAPLSFGGIAIGLLPFGAISMGMFPIGAISFGVWAYGALAFGWQICCGCGVAWNAAMGGIAVAHDFALGGIAHAAQANTETAKQFFQQNLFFRCAQTVSNHGLLMMLAWVIPVTLLAQVMKRARREREQENS